jgi:hypothetical protein
MDPWLPRKAAVGVSSLDMFCRSSLDRPGNTRPVVPPRQRAHGSTCILQTCRWLCSFRIASICSSSSAHSSGLRCPEDVESATRTLYLHCSCKDVCSELPHSKPAGSLCKSSSVQKTRHVCYSTLTVWILAGSAPCPPYCKFVLQFASVHCMVHSCNTI